MLKSKKYSLFITLILVLSFLAPGAVNAEVKGSTQYLINQAKSSKYVGKTLYQVKDAIKAQGYNGWNMGYNYHWCAWYMGNIANAAFVGNYTGTKATLKNNTFANTMGDYFAKFNDTSRKYPGSYTPKAGDIVLEANAGHIGIMISSKEAVFGNDGSANYNKTTVKIRKPYNVTYYIPRPNWYILYYSDGLSSTSMSKDMKINPVKKITFGVNTSTTSKKFTRKGYSYSEWYIYRQDFDKKTGKYTNYYYSVNNKTGKTAWVKSGTDGYTKYKKKFGTKLKFYYDSNFAGAKIIFTPVWVLNEK